MEGWLQYAAFNVLGTHLGPPHPKQTTEVITCIPSSARLQDLLQVEHVCQGYTEQAFVPSLTIRTKQGRIFMIIYYL